MRLLVISQYFWPEDFRINELVAELSRRGHSVVVLTGLPNYPDGKVFPAFTDDPARFSSYAGARVVRVPMVARGTTKASLFLNYVSFALSATLFGILKLHRESFDAVFVFEPSPVTVGLPAVALKRLKGWPIAFWVLDQWPETLAAVGIFRSERVLRWIGRLVSFIYTRCDLVLGQSKLMVDQIAEYCRGRTPTAYFPNWAESTYGTAAAVPAPEVPPSNASFNVMFAGNIGESQDFPAILDAAELLRSDDRVRWLIVGDGRMAGWVKMEIARRGLGHRVILLGRHSPERMPSFYSHADALLVALKPEPIFSMTVPGKIQSYLASGVPVIGMLDGEGAVVIEESGAGLTCPAGDGKKLAECVRRMATLTEAERSEMGKRGRDYAAVEFNRDVLVGKLESLLQGLMVAGK